MVPGFQPVQEIYKVFILPFQIQLIDLWDFHMDFIQVLQIVAYRKGRPFHRIRRTIGLDFIFQIFGWQRNNVIRLAVLDVIIFCTPFCKGFYLVPSQTVRLLFSTQYTVYRVVSQIATTKSNQKRDFFSENRSTTNRLFTRWQRHLDLPLFLLASASRPNQN